MPDQNNTKVVTASSDSVVRVFSRETQKVLYQSKKLDGAVYVACYNYKNNTNVRNFIYDDNYLKIKSPTVMYFIKKKYTFQIKDVRPLTT